jgi:hypothetical protein
VDGDSLVFCLPMQSTDRLLAAADSSSSIDTSSELEKDGFSLERDHS